MSKKKEMKTTTFVHANGLIDDSIACYDFCSIYIHSTSTLYKGLKKTDVLCYHLCIISLHILSACIQSAVTGHCTGHTGTWGPVARSIGEPCYCFLITINY